METRVQIIMIVWLLITGLSHVLRPKAWIEFFIWLRARGEAGVFVTAFLHLPPALLIVVLHPRFSGIPLVLTLLGWAWLIKATTYFLFPRIGLAGLGFVSIERRSHFVVAGFVLIGLAGLLTVPLLELS